MPERPNLRPAVFIDRDGTMIEEVGYLNHVSRFRMFPGVAEALRRLNEAGYPVIVVTNQSGVARGYFPESLIHDVTKLLNTQLADAGAKIDALYYCAHGTEVDCSCRKPKTGMLEQASREHAIDLRRSFVIGDRYLDIELAHNAHARGILVRTGYGEGELAWHSAKWPAPPDFVAADLAQGVDWVLRQPR